MKEMGGEVKTVGGRAVVEVRFKEIKTTVVPMKEGVELELLGLTADGKVFRYNWVQGYWTPLPMVTPYVE